MSDFPESEVPTLASTPIDTTSRAVSDLAKQIKDARYKRSREIGRGGMGKILEAVDKPLRRSVALKVLVRRGDAESQNRFVREARITGALEHPSIVPVHELNVDETGELFYTMKLVRGATLLQILQNLARRDPETLRRYPLASLLTIFQKVCDAVAFAHSLPEPVIHRDLKPENIMVGNYGEVLVMDWGAAKILRLDAQADKSWKSADADESAGNGEVDSDAFVTQVGSVIGTPGYMAPEQARGQTASADERTDIYALGAILYAILAWEAPIRLTGEHAAAFAEKAQNGENVTHAFHQHVAPLLSDRSARQKLGHPVLDSLVHVVLKAMSFRPEDRFQSVKQLQDDVAAYQAGRATMAEQAGAWKHFKLLIARNKVLFSSIASIFVILLVATGISLYERQAALKSNQSLQLTLHNASEADLEAARQKFRAGASREGLALLARSLGFWPQNGEAAHYLLCAVVFGNGDSDKLPIVGVYHKASIGEAAFNPDGRSFVTASDDGTAQVWDAQTGGAIGKPLKNSAPVDCARFSPDGSKIVTTDDSGVARVWDARTGDPLTKPMQHGKPGLDSESKVETAVFSPDGAQVLTASWDHTARLWNAENGEQIAELVNRQRVSDAVFSADGTRILSSCWRGATLWGAKTFQQIGPFMDHNTTVRRSMFTPDGSKIVTTCLEYKIARLWDGHTAQSLGQPLKHDDYVWDLDISSDGKLLATASSDKTARLWSVEDGSPRGVPLKHEGPVNTAVFSPDGKHLVTASRDKTVRLWNTDTCQATSELMRHDDSVLKAIFSPDGTKILSIGADSAAYLWDAASSTLPGQIIPIEGKVCSVEFDDTDDRIFVAERDGRTGVWSLRGRKFVTPVGHGKAVSAAAFYSLTNEIATANNDGTITFWDAANGKQIGETAPTKDDVVAMEFSLDGRSLFTAHRHGTVLNWKIPEGIQVGPEIKLPENMDGLAVAPAGTEIATGCGDDRLRFWEPSTGKASRNRIRLSQAALSICYDPNGPLIATGCEDHTARIWSLDTGKQQGEPFYLNGRATAVRYTPDGRALFVGSVEDTNVNCYDTKTHDSLYPPLAHPTGVSHITSNLDGSFVITVDNDGVARLWRIPTTSEPPPRWLSEYIRALGGLAFTAHQQLVQVPTRERLELRKKLLGQPPENTIWDKLMRWSFQQKPGPVPRVR